MHSKKNAEHLQACRRNPQKKAMHCPKLCYNLRERKRAGSIMEINFVIQSLAEMEQLALQISHHLRPGFVLGLGGDLGSGKTTFTKFLAKHMGIKDTVNSPTFTLLKVYANALPLYHMDVYRLESIGYDYELDDYLYGRGVSVVEWYPYIAKMLPSAMLEINIKVLSENAREITIKGSGEYANIIQDLSHRYSN
jgi:tRNA threonylcarbamoyladenosine biosynthesis protein TsaE